MAVCLGKYMFSLETSFVKTSKTNIKDELTDYSAKVRVEIVCNDELAQVLMDRIVTVCQTGQMGDGVVWCTEVPKAFFIAKTSA